MTAPVVVLVGELASHARGKTLARTLGALAAPLPNAGVALGFARAFQDSPNEAAANLAWTDRPGRALVLLPPFAKETCSTPVSWEARRTEPVAGGDTPISRVLAAERTFELRGNLLPIERAAGQVVTATWRRHPAAGVLVVTALPLWSLRAIEHHGDCRSWLHGIVDLAGVALPEATTAPDAALVPTPDDWTLLLHFSGGPYPTRRDALDALVRSTTFAVAPSAAEAALTRLDAAGWVVDGTVTARGEHMLNQSSYAAYARTIRRMRHART